MTETSKTKRFLAVIIAVAMFAGITGIFPFDGYKVVAAESSALDVAKAFGINPNETLDEDLANNPYGTKGWFPLFIKSELVELKSYEGKGSRELNVFRHEDNSNSKVTLNGRKKESTMTTSGGASLTRVTGADLTGTGRKEYIVSLAYVDDDKKLYLSVNNQKKQLDQVTVETGEMLHDAESYHAISHMAVVAGDFDADGKDTIMVYAPQSRTIKEYAFSNNNLEYADRSINLGDTLGPEGRDRLNLIMATEDDEDDDQLRATPSISMIVEDTDRDGKDELVIGASWNDVPKDDYKNGDKKQNVDWQASWLSIWDMNGSSWSRSFREVLEKDNTETAKGRARFVGVTAGNFSAGSDFPDIVASGYIDQSDKDGTNIDEGKFTLYMYRYNGNGYSRVLNDEQYEFNKFTTGGTYDENKIQDPIAVVAFSGRGIEQTDYLFVEGDVYEFNESEGKFVFVKRGSYFDDDDDGIGRFIISDSVIVDAVAANFDGNLEGREQVYFTTSQKYKHGGSYFWRTYEYAFGKADQDGNYPFQHKQYDWAIYQEGQSAVTVAAVDIGTEDGMLAKIESKELTYTKPEIMAILEAPPVFDEINDGDLGNGMTEYGTEDGEGGGSISGTAVSASVMAGFEYTDPITSSGGGFEATISNTWTSETTKTEERTVEIAYANDMGENAVLMFCTPVTLYNFTVKSKLPGAKKENSMQIGVHGVPATNLMTVENYNKLAASYEMEQITEGVQKMLATPGNPASYRDYLPKSEKGDQSWDSGTFTSYSGSGTVSQSVTDTWTEEKSSTYEFMAEVTAFVSVCGAKAGVGGGGGFTSGSISFNSSSVRKEGAVTARPTDVENAENYDFNWKFATWTQKLNGENVPVLGYIVNGVKAPPSPADNLALSEQTDDSMLLTWEPGRRVAAQYTVYRYNPDDRYKPYIVVGQVNGGTIEDNTYSYRLNNLQSNTTYQYVVSGTGADGIESVYSQPTIGTTLSRDTEPIVIKDPSDTSALKGQQAQFKAEIVSWGSYSRVSYQWQEKLPSENWANIKGEEDRVLTVPATEQKNGAQYRCIVFGQTSDATQVPFYTGAATLTVGAENITPEFKIDNASVDYTYANPYIRKASYVEITSSDGEPVEYDETVMVEIDENEVPVTSVEMTTDTGSTITEYVVKVNDKYYVLKEDDGTYSVDDTRNATVSSTYSYSNSEGKVDALTSGEPMAVDINGETYYLYLELNNVSWDKPVGTEGSNGELISASIGKVYASRDEVNFYEYTEGMTSLGEPVTITDSCEMVVMYQIVESAQYLFIHTDTQYTYDSENEDMDEKEVERFYLATRGAEGATDSFEIVEQTEKIVFSLIGYEEKDISADGLKLSVVTKQGTYTPVVYNENKISGDMITFNVKTTKVGEGGNPVPANGASFVISLINQTSGTTDTLVGTTNANGIAEVNWNPQTAGLYAVKVVVGGNETPTQYLLATDSNLTQSVLTVEDSQGKTTATTYGETLKLSTEKVDAQTNSKTDLTDISYKYKLGNSNEEVDISTPTAFVPQVSGEYTINAYSNEDSSLVATTKVTVKKRNIEIKLNWTGQESGTAVSADEITLSAEGIVQADWGALNNSEVFTITSDAFNENGNLKPGLSGAYSVYVEYTTDAGGYNTDAAEAFIAKYNAVLGSSQFLCLPDSYPVSFTCGENGEIEARYDYYGQTFDSGAYIEIGKEILFTAKPSIGFAVDKWYINDEALDPDDNRISDAGKRLTIASFSKSDLGASEEGAQQKLEVMVTFKSASLSVSYAVSGEGGVLSAATAAGEPVENGGNVANGATVTFTAVPDENMVVAKWAVDGVDYLWENSNELYRENTLTIENMDKNVRVEVHYSELKSHTLTATVEPETDGVDVAGIMIKAVDVATGDDADLTDVIDGEAITFSVPVSDTLGVKEWQVDKGNGFETIVGSGGESSINVYDITGSWQVKVILTTAQTYTINYKVALNGEEVTDTSIAELNATHNDSPIASGSETPAYIVIDFTLRLDSSYYVVDWENAIPSDNLMAATMVSLEGDTNVVVNIAKKPVVTINENTDGTISVTATVDGEETVISSGDYVDPGSDLKVTLTPYVGYVVADSVNAEYEDGTGETTDKKVYTISDVDEDTVIEGIWTALAQYNVTYSVYDSNADEDGGMNGEITSVKAERKGLEDYKNEDLQNYDIIYGGSVLTITALAEEDFRVQEWYINGNVYKPDGITYIGEELVLDKLAEYAENEEINIQVKFTRLGNKTTVEAGTGGAITSVTLVGSGSDLTENIAEGFTVTPEAQICIVAEAEPGYEIDGWYVNNEPIENEVGSEYIYTASADGFGAVIAVKFRQVPYHVYWSAEKGTVTVAGIDGDAAQIRGGEEINFTASADTGYEFSHWTLNGEIIEGAETETLVWTVPNGEELGVYIFEVEAVFERGTYTVTYVSPANGTLEATVNSGDAIISGEEVEFTATPDDNYIVIGWKVNSVEKEIFDTEFSVIVNDDTEVEVILAPSSYTVTYTAQSGGLIAAEGFEGGIAIVEYGESIVFTATPNDYNRVLEWSVNENVVTENISADGTTFTLTDITEDTVVIVSFADAIGFDVSYEALENGILDVTRNGIALILRPDQVENVAGNTALAFTARANAGFMVSGWTVNGTAVTRENMEALGVTMEHPASNVLSIEKLRANADVKVSFEAYADFDIPASTADYEISDVQILPVVEGYENKVRKGGDISFKVSVAQGKAITLVDVNQAAGEEVTVTRNEDGTYTVAVKGIKAELELNVGVSEGVSVTLTATENGSITAKVDDTVIANGSVVMPGDIITFTATANSGYKLGDITVNGTSVKDTKTYTVATSDTVIIVKATFAKNSGGTGGGGGGGSATTFTVKFETNGGSEIANKTVTRNGKLAEPEVPTKNGYNFIGWFTDDELTTAYDFDMVVTKNFTLYAKWDGGIDSDWINPFEDVNESDWFFEDVKYVNKNALMNGTSGTTFAPDENLTRAMLVTVLWRLEEEPVVNYLMSFDDIEAESWYTEAVRWAASEGIVKGVSETAFAPEDNITREQIATIMHRYAQYKGIDVSVGENTNILSYDDFDSISEYAIASMQYAVGSGLIKGKSESTLNPLDNATRAEIAAILHRFIEANK